MDKTTLKLHSVKDEFLARGRVILAKGHGNNYSVITGKKGFNPYDKIQMDSFIEQLNELTENEYDAKDKDIRREIRKIANKIQMFGAMSGDEIRPSSFYFRLPDMPTTESMKK